MTKSPIKLYLSEQANYLSYWYLSIRVINKFAFPVMKEALAYNPAFLQTKITSFSEAHPFI